MCFSATASTKISLRAVTYAQNFCCDVVGKRLTVRNRYQTHSEAKLLIHKDLLNCFFYRQSSESLDLQGLQPCVVNLSTKLSTENLNICKVPLNQSLSVLFACVGQTMSTISHTFQPAI